MLSLIRVCWVVLLMVIIVMVMGLRIGLWLVLLVLKIMFIDWFCVWCWWF